MALQIDAEQRILDWDPGVNDRAYASSPWYESTAIDDYEPPAFDLRSDSRENEFFPIADGTLDMFPDWEAAGKLPTEHVHLLLTVPENGVAPTGEVTFDEGLKPAAEEGAEEFVTANSAREGAAGELATSISEERSDSCDCGQSAAVGPVERCGC